MKRLSIFIVCFISCGLLLAQNAEDQILQDLSGNGNTVLIDQLGNNNEITAEQIQLGDAEINLIDVYQEGDDNKVFLFQEGAGNQIHTLQFGSENLHELNLQGTGNTIYVFQEGLRNKVTQELSEFTDVKVIFIQQGNDNEIIHEQTGLSGQYINVTQIGNGLKMIIRQE